MKKFFNSVDGLIPEMLGGFIKAFGNSYYKIPKYNGIVYGKKREKVSVIAAGGSLGEPWCLGTCGEGMADAVAVGNIFASPSATNIAALCGEVYNDKGILIIIGNHTGDVLNAELGRDLFLIENKNKDCRIIKVTDELTSKPKNEKNCRRSLVGAPLIIFVAGHASEEGLSIDEVERIANKANENLSSVSAVLGLGTNPITEKTMGEIPSDEVCFGMGVTGEPGIRSEKYCGEHETTKILLDYLFDDLELKKDDEIALAINGFGSVSMLENLIVANTAIDIIKGKGIKICDVDVNDKLRIQETNSIAISIMKLDKELKKYYCGKSVSPLMYRKHF